MLFAVIGIRHMEIKKNLKALDVKISKLATDLGISRPTLDTYIECYEKGQPIPNEGYQKIFEYLFDTEEMDSIDFARKFDYVKRVMLKDAKNGVERNFLEQREAALSDKIKEMIDDGTVNKSLLEFFNLFANNKDNSLVKAIYMYFNYSNGFADMSKAEISELDKALFSNFSQLFEEYKKGNLVFNTESYNQMLEKNRSMFEKKKAKLTQADLINYIKAKLNDESELDVEALKQMIARMEDK